MPLLLLCRYAILKLEIALLIRHRSSYITGMPMPEIKHTKKKNNKENKKNATGEKKPMKKVRNI